MPRPTSTSARRDELSQPPPYKRNHDRRSSIPLSSVQEQPPPYPSPHQPTVHSSILQPRVAVALNLPAKWHPLLFACRLLSCLPAAWWGLPVAVSLLAQAHLWYIVETGMGSCSADNSLCLAGLSWLRGRVAGTGADLGIEAVFERRLRVTEMALGIVWCFAAGYLSFFFTDCLMSRWLVNYTPQATLVRLLTINACNMYLTSWVLHLTGGLDDPRLFLPAWITIATTLTGMYHATQRKINIRKETRLSTSVFSIASFISMVALLAQLNFNRQDFPNPPLFVLAKKAGLEVFRLASRTLEYRTGPRTTPDEL